MSPAYSTDPDDVFSWVGIIMYLPQDPKKRELVTSAFQRYYVTAIAIHILRFYIRYCDSMNFLVDQYKGQAHWAKIELPNADSNYESNINKMRTRIASKYPVSLFNEYRFALDPNSILSNRMVDELFRPSS